MTSPISTKLDKSTADQLMRAALIPIPPVERNARYKSELSYTQFIMYCMAAGYVLLLVGLAATILGCCLGAVVALFSAPIFAVMAMVCVPFLFIVFVGLIKPVFVKSDRDLEPLELTPKNEPFLFNFVNAICRSVGAQPPKSIVVSHEVNAGASFIKGTQDLQLTVGLPLAMGLNTRQFAGVIAHEFGHFSQSDGMNTSLKIRRMSSWFAQSAFEKDAWDEFIDRTLKRNEGPIALLLYLPKVGFFVARLMLMGLTMCGHYFAARLLREMEFDADRSEARLAGSQSFAATCRQMQLLGVCQSAAMGDLDRYRREKRLPDNLPKMIVSNISHINSDKFRELEHKLLEAKTEWHDTHPSDRERIQNAVKENAAGTFQVELPTGLLFADLDGLSRLETLRLYRHVFGSDFKPQEIRDANEIISKKKIEMEEDRAALRFILHQFCGIHSFHLPRFSLGQAIDTKEFKEQTAFRRDRLYRDVRGYHLLRKQERNFITERSKAVAARRLIEAGFNVSGANFVYPATSLFDANARASNLAHQEADIKNKLKGFRQMMGLRMIDALEFLRSEKITDRIGESVDAAREANHILSVLETLVRCKDSLQEFFTDFQVGVILSQIVESHNDPQTVNSFRAAVHRIHALITHIQSQTWQTDYPFDHGKGRVSIAYFLIDNLPSPNDLFAVLASADDFDSNLKVLLIRCLSRLGALAEKVEAVFGFPPLEAPIEVKTNDDD